MVAWPESSCLVLLSRHDVVCTNAQRGRRSEHMGDDAPHSTIVCGGQPGVRRSRAGGAQEAAGSRVTVTNHRGDQVPHPAITESEQQSLTLVRLLVSLRVPPGEEAGWPQRHGGAGRRALRRERPDAPRGAHARRPGRHRPGPSGRRPPGTSTRTWSPVATFAYHRRSGRRPRSSSRYCSPAISRSVGFRFRPSPRRSRCHPCADGGTPARSRVAVSRVAPGEPARPLRPGGRARVRR